MNNGNAYCIWKKPYTSIESVYVITEIRRRNELVYCEQNVMCWTTTVVMDTRKCSHHFFFTLWFLLLYLITILIILWPEIAALYTVRTRDGKYRYRTRIFIYFSAADEIHTALNHLLLCKWMKKNEKKNLTKLRRTALW